MDIEVENLGKRFNREWIFRNLDLNIPQGQKLAITGRNGSGKSTLLKILGAYSLQTEGKVSYFSNGRSIVEDQQLCINFAAPYFNLIEEFSLSEQLAFHQKFKEPVTDLNEALRIAGLYEARNKAIKDFSSGMKQRTKLILAFYFASDIICLDEPTSNLDEAGNDLFKSMMGNCDKNRSIIIASNLNFEIDLCHDKIILENYKSKHKILK